MKVLKFGGTSVGSAERMKFVAQLINDNRPKIVVLSAMSGTTNKLVEISDYLYKKNFDTANDCIAKLESNYLNVIQDLYLTDAIKEEATSVIRPIFMTIRSLVGANFNENGEKVILAQGELISTNLFHLFLKEQKIDSILLMALEFMKTNEHSEPDYASITANIKLQLDNYNSTKLFITQGYICMNHENNIDNLKRGGSDYSASIIGAAVLAEEIQIWTDIDGMHNNDPRYVQNTHPINYLSFDEAAELAYFGAKILHPTTILPAQHCNIPVILKNTMEPSAAGTIISKETKIQGIKAIAAKDGITMIKIRSTRMFLAYGFLSRVFKIFEKYKTPIDMITTSEVGVSVSIDNTKFLNNILEELKEFGHTTVIPNQTIICMVGYAIAENKSVIRNIFDALVDIPVQMVSYGGSIYNVSVLIDEPNKINALIELNKKLF